MKPIVTIMKWSSYFLLSSSVLIAQDTIEERNQKAKQVEIFYNLAEKAYLSGDIEAAKESIRAALDLNHKHGRSIALYRRMKSGGGDRALLALRKRTFSKVVIPLIDIDELSCKDALRVLSDAVERESKDKVIPNFVIQDRNKTLEKTTMTLKLRNVPAGEVLNHILSESNATANFGKYSTVIRSRSTSSPVKKAKPVTDPEEEKDPFK